MVSDSLIHAGIAAGAAFFGALASGIADGILSLLNLEVAAIAAGGAFFASLAASHYMGGEPSPPQRPPSS